jgi:hypothetical protein
MSIARKCRSVVVRPLNRGDGTTDSPADLAGDRAPALVALVRPRGGPPPGAADELEQWLDRFQPVGFPARSAVRVLVAHGDHVLTAPASVHEVDECDWLAACTAIPGSGCLLSKPLVVPRVLRRVVSGGRCCTIDAAIDGGGDALQTVEVVEHGRP